jgi:hypothetical protein
MSNQENRAKVMVSKNLLDAVYKLYPEASSYTAALQMHLVLTLKQTDQLASNGIIRNDTSNLLQE